MIRRIQHFLFRKHSFYVIKQFSYTSRKVGCKFCKKKWAMCDRTESLLEWDGYFDELYSHPVYQDFEKNHKQQLMEKYIQENLL